MRSSQIVKRFFEEFEWRYDCIKYYQLCFWSEIMNFVIGSFRSVRSWFVVLNLYFVLEESLTWHLKLSSKESGWDSRSISVCVYLISSRPAISYTWSTSGVNWGRSWVKQKRMYAYFENHSFLEEILKKLRRTTSEKCVSAVCQVMSLLDESFL